MKTKQIVAMAVTALVISLGAGTTLAQNNNNADPNNNGQGRQRGNRGGGGGNFDPAQFQQRMMDNYKEQLEITDDTEWNAIKPLVQKVMDARLASMSGMGRGMFGGRNRGGGNDNGGGNGGNGGGGSRFGGTPSAEADALRKAIDSKASNSELKTAIAKYVESRKSKQAELEKAQSDLRKVLSVRQEAIATQIGLL